MSARAIAYTVDDNIECFLQLAASINSVRKFHKDPIDVYILTNKPHAWMSISGAKVVDVSGLVDAYGLDKTGIVWRKHPVSPMLLFRLLIPLVDDLKAYDEVLYLDSDTEVWNPRFFSIFDSLGGHEVAAVQDSLGPNGTHARISNLLSAHPLVRTRDAQEGVCTRWHDLLDGTRKYVNSGVVVFDMKKLVPGYALRARKIVDRLVELKPKYPDQDVLNVYYDISIVDDRRYNGWGSYENRAWLRHYVGFERKRHAEYPFYSICRPNDILDGTSRNGWLGRLSPYVDRVYVLTPDVTSQSFRNLRDWLSSIGVSKFTTVQTAYTGRYDILVDQSAPGTRVQKEHVDNIVGHYKAIVDALADDCTRIAVFEDSFEPRCLERHLNELSQSMDVAVCTASDGLAFRRSEDCHASSSKGFLLGRRAMIGLRAKLESMFSGESALSYIHKLLNNEALPHMRTYKRG